MKTTALDQFFEQLVDDATLIGLIDAARREDLGATGDVTSDSFVDGEAPASGEFRSRAAGRLAGVKLLGLVAKRYDPRLHVAAKLRDGESLAAGDVIAAIRGPLRSILAAERVMLNFITHLSGIATLTARYVHAAQGTKAGIYDTRKTIPGYRGLAKYAVACGGGRNHRLGLHDAMLIKDNHLAGVSRGEWSEALGLAIAEARRRLPPVKFVEVEVDDLDALRIVLGCDVDIVLLDNMTPDQLAEAVKIRDGLKPGAALEASGGGNLDTVVAIAASGVDRISVGGLTHSAAALDIALDIRSDA